MQNAKSSSWVLVLIGCGKLFKAAMLLFIATRIRYLLHHDVRQTLEHWVHIVRVDPHNRHVHNLIFRVTGISPLKLEEISLGSFLYAALFGTEGIGLVLRKQWAEYMTVITTGLLLPMELYEIFHGHHHIAKIIVFILNVVIVVYLVIRLKKEMKGEIKEEPNGFPIEPSA